MTYREGIDSILDRQDIFIEELKDRLTRIIREKQQLKAILDELMKLDLGEHVKELLAKYEQK
jgi:hypothetical protein